MSNPKKKASSNPSMTSSTDRDAIAQVMALLGPLVDFHQKVGAAGPDDLRIYWDVRVIRGEDIPFMSTSGSSTLPGCLSEKQQANASTTIQQEVNDKIAVPLVGRIQQFVEDESALALTLRANAPLPPPAPPRLPGVEVDDHREARDAARQFEQLENEQ